jgi:hypothetical protein
MYHFLCYIATDMDVPQNRFNRNELILGEKSRNVKETVRAAGNNEDNRTPMDKTSTCTTLKT